MRRNLDTMTHDVAGVIPQFTRGDRLRKARNLTGLSTRDFAEKIGVSQKTVTDAENDHRAVIRKILLNAWALATGVPADWLETGNAPARPEPDGGNEASPGHARTDVSAHPLVLAA